MFAAFSVVNGDGSLSKIEILDPEPQRLHLPEAAPIDFFAEQSPGILHLVEDGSDFLAGKNRGRSTGPVPSGGKPEVQVLDTVNHFTEKG